jgi:hypothetical protein
MPLDPTLLEQLKGSLLGLALTREAVTVVDGWRCDLDGDSVQETILRVKLGESGSAVILDPQGPESRLIEDMRIFWIRDLPLAHDKASPQTPFAFRSPNGTYLAWGYTELLGPGMRSQRLVALRPEGAGYWAEVIDLP